MKFDLVSYCSKDINNCYIVLVDDDNCKHDLIVDIAIGLQIEITDFIKNLKNYNGFNTSNGYLNGFEMFNYMLFKNKHDANKFIVEYLNPLLITKMLIKNI